MNLKSIKHRFKNRLKIVLDFVSVLDGFLVDFGSCFSCFWEAAGVEKIVFRLGETLVFAFSRYRSRLQKILLKNVLSPVRLHENAVFLRVDFY